MDIQAITSSNFTTAQPLTSAASAASASPELSQTTATPAFEASFLTVSASQTEAGPDLQAQDLTALAEQALLAQQTVLSAMRSGSTDVSTLLSGLPAGATATLLGGGWARVPAGATAEEAGTVWAFLFPLRREHVPAVTTSSKAAATREKEHDGAREGEPLAFYGPHGEKEPLPAPPGTSTVDILD
jgi:hypothetical protein